MISFIIIGRNEGWKLTKCLHSVVKTIKHNNLDQYEIIYVDSKSTDDSVEIAKSFKEVKVFSITGECNAAIARNIGAKESKGEVLFFIDGDMEIIPIFISKAINKRGELKYDYITGHLDDYLYTYEDEFLGIRQRTYTGSIPVEKQKLVSNGGVFLVKRKIWNKVEGMKTKYRRSQDLDFSLRLKRKGVQLIRLPYLIVKHHTVDYRNENRMWKNLKEGYVLFFSLLFRDHIFTLLSWIRLFRTQYSAVLLFLVIATAPILELQLFQLLGIYCCLLLFRTTIHVMKTQTKQNKMLFMVNRFIYQLVNDIMFWVGVFFFFPSSSKISYKRV